MKLQFAIAALLPIAAWAAGPFDGTWKTRIETMQFAGKPDVFELSQGVFKCGRCAPPYSVKADGNPQKVSGHSYYDAVRVRVIDDHTVELSNSLNGKPIFGDLMKVSADGTTLTESLKDMTGALTATGTQVSKRLAAGPAGSHAIAGSWKILKVPEASEPAISVTYRMTTDGLQMTWNGQSYDAKFDGRQYPIANDPGRTVVSLKRVAGNTIEETDSRDGKVTDIIRMTVSGDGQTMSVVDKDVQRDATSSYEMARQPR